MMEFNVPGKHIKGEAMVYGNAQVHGNAVVTDQVVVTDNATVYGNAKVSDDAEVFGNAKVSGNVKVTGKAKVSEDARVYGDAKIYGAAEVSGRAQVYGGAQVFALAQVNGDAKVSGDALVSDRAEVYGAAKVYGYAVVSDRSRVSDNALVFEHAVVAGRALVYDHAVVAGNALVSGDAEVFGNAKVSGLAKVYGDAEVKGKARIGGKAKIYGGVWDGSEGPINEGSWDAPGVPHGGNRMASLIRRVASRHMAGMDGNLYSDIRKYQDENPSGPPLGLKYSVAVFPKVRTYRILVALYEKNIMTPAGLHAWASRISDINTAIALNLAAFRLFSGRWDWDYMQDANAGFMQDAWWRDSIGKRWLPLVMAATEQRAWEIAGVSKREKPPSDPKPAPKWDPPSIPDRLIPMTAEGWELYQAMPGSERAARSLGASLRVALEMAGRKITPHNKDEKNAAIVKAILSRMAKVLTTYSRFGAMDTEPPYHARHAFRKYLGGYLDHWTYPKTFNVIEGWL